MCGNGIVEEGEDCDPGSEATSSCCDAKTCKFINNAQCDPTNDACCTNSCQFAASTQTCRPAISGGCDIAETCTGNSRACPSDVFKPNGQTCGANGLACASGQCTSISQQCAVVGMSMNLTAACPNRNTATCQISCQDPQDANSCIVLQSELVDGSPCGYGGSCSQGNCQAGPLLDTIKSWYVQNLQISIPVTVVVCIVAILLLWSLVIMIKRCCVGERKAAPPPKGLGGRAQRIPSWAPGADMASSMQPVHHRDVPSHRLSIPPALHAGRSDRPSSFTRSSRTNERTGLGRY